MNVRTKKVEATSAEQLDEEEVIEFVREIIAKDGFPYIYMIKYVYFKDGFLYVTPEMPEIATLDTSDGKVIVFYIETLNNCISLYNNLRNIKKSDKKNNDK